MAPLLEEGTPAKPAEVVVKVDTSAVSTPTTFWSRVWDFTKKYLLKPVPALIFAAGAILLVLLGSKNAKIGGLLGSLLGKKGSKPAVETANTVPEDRVREDGTPIKPGEPDSKGIIQAEVVPIQTPGIFGDSSKVKIEDPKTGETIEVDVPDGVKAKDVDQVVVVRPEVHVVSVENSSPVTKQDIKDLLEKYKK